MVYRHSQHVPRVLLALVLALTLAFGPLASADASFFGSTSPQPEHAPDRVLVSFKPGTPAAAKAAAHASLGAKSRATIPGIGVEVIEVPKRRSVERLVRAYLKNPNVEYAEPDFVVEALSAPDDPYYPSQWGLPAIDAPESWEITQGDSSVTVAILDTGIDSTHPDLAGRLVPGYDFVNDEEDAEDDHGHGTLVAGIVGANTDNGIGIAGVDWSTRLMPVKVLNSHGSGFWSQIAPGIVHAADNGAHVINMSLGGSGSLTGAQAVEYAYDKGVTLVAAAGNNGRDSLSYPAAYPQVIAVGALADETELASYSNHGDGLSLVAPGSNIYSTRMGGTYARATGTSMAAPFVAGLASTLLGVDPSLTPSQVETVMQQTATDLGEPGYDLFYGHGRIDMRSAVKAVSGSQPDDPAQDPEPDDPVQDPEPEEPEQDPEPEPTPDDPEYTDPPNVKIVSPADSSTVSGNIWFEAEASSDVGIEQVSFYVDGVLVGSATSEPFRTRLNTRRFSGVVTLTAVAEDTEGTSAVSKPVKVSVENGGPRNRSLSER